MIFYLKKIDDGASLTRRRRFMNWSIVISIEPESTWIGKPQFSPQIAQINADYQAITDKSLITQSVEIQTLGL
jgi:hypothetical protein